MNVVSTNEGVWKKRKENLANVAKEKVHLKVAKEREIKARNIGIVLETKSMKKRRNYCPHLQVLTQAQVQTQA